VCTTLFNVEIQANVPFFFPFSEKNSAISSLSANVRNYKWIQLKMSHCFFYKCVEYVPQNARWSHSFGRFLLSNILKTTLRYWTRVINVILFTCQLNKNINKRMFLLQVILNIILDTLHASWHWYVEIVPLQEECWHLTEPVLLEWAEFTDPFPSFVLTQN